MNNYLKKSLVAMTLLASIPVFANQPSQKNSPTAPNTGSLSDGEMAQLALNTFGTMVGALVTMVKDDATKPNPVAVAQGVGTIIQSMIGLVSAGLRSGHLRAGSTSDEIIAYFENLDNDFKKRLKKVMDQELEILAESQPASEARPAVQHQ